VDRVERIAQALHRACGHWACASVETTGAQAADALLRRRAMSTAALIVGRQPASAILRQPDLAESGSAALWSALTGAQGIAQFMQDGREQGLSNPFDPIHALSAAGKFLHDLAQQFGNLGLAAAAYNAGPKRVSDWMAKRGKLPGETRNYVRNITGRPAEEWARTKVEAEHRMPAQAPCIEVARALQAQPSVLEAQAPNAQSVFNVAGVPTSVKLARFKIGAGEIAQSRLGQAKLVPGRRRATEEDDHSGRGIVRQGRAAQDQNHVTGKERLGRDQAGRGTLGGEGGIDQGRDAKSASKNAARTQPRVRPRARPRVPRCRSPPRTRTP